MVTVLTKLSGDQGGQTGPFATAHGTVGHRWGNTAATAIEIGIHHCVTIGGVVSSPIGVVWMWRVEVGRQVVVAVTVVARVRLMVMMVQTVAVGNTRRIGVHVAVVG